MIAEPGIEFVTCPDPRADREVKRLIEWAVEEITSALGAGVLRSIILTGAMTEGEGSVRMYEDGRMTILSDLDLYLVVAAGHDVERIRSDVSALARRLRADVPEGRMASSFDLAAVRPEDIAAVQPEIGTVDLRNRGRVVWGDDVLSPLRPLDPTVIGARDPVTLIHNRIAEELDHGPGKCGSAREMSVYHSAKTGADLALAILTLLGEYRPTYRERAGRLREIWDRAELAWLRKRLPDLPERVEGWTAYKLAPSGRDGVSGAGRSPAESGDDGLWISLIPVVEAVWIWAMQRWTGTGEEDPRVLVKNIGSGETARERLRAWKSAWVRGQVGRGVVDVFRAARGAFGGSPRSRLYGALSLVYFAAPGRVGIGAGAPDAAGYLARARTLMPFRPVSGEGDWESLRVELVGYWKRDVMRNMR